MLARARTLDPLSPQIYMFVLSSGMARGDFEGAIQAGRDAVEIAPDHPWLHGYFVRALALAGQHEEAMRVLDDAMRRMPSAPNLRHERALVLALANRDAEARAAIEMIPEKDWSLSKVIALAYAALGEKDRAVETFERMARDHANFARINIDMPPHPAFEAVRADPRYHALHKELGIPLP